VAVCRQHKRRRHTQSRNRTIRHQREIHRFQIDCMCVTVCCYTLSSDPMTTCPSDGTAPLSPPPFDADADAGRTAIVCGVRMGCVPLPLLLRLELADFDSIASADTAAAATPVTGRVPAIVPDADAGAAAAGCGSDAGIASPIGCRHSGQVERIVNQ